MSASVDTLFEVATRNNIPTWFMVHYCSWSSAQVGGRLRVRMPGRHGDRLFASIDRAAEAIVMLMMCDRSIDGAINLSKFVEQHSTLA